MRGSPAAVIVNSKVVGIIPAGAGLTRLERSREWATRDHPRGCGAHINGNNYVSKTEGIIPAGAGLTMMDKDMRYDPRDHPRGCGAHVKM